MQSGIVHTILRRQCGMVGRPAGAAHPIRLLTATADMANRLQCREIGRRLITAPEGRDIALQPAIQLQPKRRSDDHVAGPFVFARMEMSGIETDGKENGMRKRRAKGFDDQERIIRIGAEDPDGSSSFTLILDSIDQRPHIVHLTGPLRTLTRAVFRAIGPCGFGFVFPRHLAIQPAQVAVPLNVQAQRFIVGLPPNLKIDGMRNIGAPLLDRHRNLDRLQVPLGKGCDFLARSGSKLDRERPSVERIPFPDQDHRIPPEANLPALQFRNQ